MKHTLLFFLLLLFTNILPSQTVTVGFTYTTMPNGTVIFSNTSSPLAQGTYTWNFGNGISYTTALSPTVSTTYTISGEYTVLLTSPFSTAGNALSYMLPNCPLIADMSFTHAVDSPTVNFTSLSTGTTPSTTYLWDFGDGSTTSGIAPTHIYQSNSAYFYTLTAVENATCAAFVIASVGSTLHPLIQVCGYTPSLSFSTTGNLTTFSISNMGWPWYFAWDVYNNGLPLSTIAPSVNVTYFNGTWPVSVTMFSSLLNCTTTTLNTAVTISNNPCYVDAAFTYTPGSNGQVQFTKTAPSSNSNIAYSWDFGDGTAALSTNPVHNYSSAGTYTAILISYDIATPPYDSGDTAYFAFLCRTYSVAVFNLNNLPCIANSGFTLFPAGAQQYYINMSYPYNVASAQWDWGDGTFSNTLYANHTYSAAGTYSICLTVTTSCGVISSSCSSQYLSKGASGDMLYVSVNPTPVVMGVTEQVARATPPLLYPNPAENGLLNVRWDAQMQPEEFSVTNSLGQELYRQSCLDAEQPLQLDLDLPDGIYVFRLNYGHYTLNSRFIVTNKD